MRRTFGIILFAALTVLSGCAPWNSNLWFDKMRGTLERSRIKYETKISELADLYPTGGYDSPAYQAVLSELKKIERDSMKKVEKLTEEGMRKYSKLNVSDQLSFRITYRNLIAEYYAERNKWIGFPNYTIENNREQSYNVVIRLLILNYQQMFGEAYVERQSPVDGSN
jgi:hypothetical protein